MKITLKGARPVNESQIAAFEESGKLSLPLDYREFVLENNGARPEMNVFAVGEGNNSGVSEFIALDEIMACKKHIDNVGCSFVPVAWAECGNYACIDLDAGGEVFFWDHEEPSSDLRLAPSFTDFLRMLEPFDVGQIELKPGQVKEAWIDPDFLKGLE
jgi:SMI1 / KNR4 family (SUKH-1)